MGKDKSLRKAAQLGTPKAPGPRAWIADLSPLRAGPDLAQLKGGDLCVLCPCAFGKTEVCWEAGMMD